VVVEFASHGILDGASRLREVERVGEDGADGILTTLRLGSGPRLRDQFGTKTTLPTAALRAVTNARPDNSNLILQSDTTCGF
jgi:hypothetical protein